MDEIRAVGLGVCLSVYLSVPCHAGKRAVYLDLDTVITGPLDDLLDYRGGFATLQTDGMANERRCGGINSSVMLWCAGDMPQVYTELMRMLPYSVDYARKFDHWLEMMTITDSSSGSSSSNSSAGGDSGSGNSSRGSPPLWLQELLPGCVAEYSSLVAAGGADLAIVKTPSSSSPVVVKGKGGGPRLVCFPLDPKPHHDVCTRQRWIRYHWLGEQDKPEE